VREKFDKRILSNLQYFDDPRSKDVQVRDETFEF